MSLTGPALYVLLMFLTLGGFSAAVVLLGRVRGSGGRPVVARVLMLAGVNALVVLTAAVGLNDNYGFYADWTDLHNALLGVSPASSTVQVGADVPEVTPSKRATV
ncbi:MAG: hypothetical protein JWM84_1424, partial [Nocardioides sp.]|nr:hypothetical protein [Nocardioides sp.]